MLARVDEIVSKVLFQLSDEAQRKATKGLVIDFMNDVEKDIARRALALPAFKSVSLVSGTVEYDLKCNIYTIQEFQTPASWVNVPPLNIPYYGIMGDFQEDYEPVKLEVVKDLNVWVAITQLPSMYSTPHWVKIWDQSIELYPAPTQADTLSFWCYLYPTKMDENSTVPSLPEKWDVCLRYGTLAQIAGGDWTSKYEAELGKLSHDSVRGSMKGVNRKASTTDSLGF